MKTKIFIISPWMKIGGIESSLIGLLKEMDYSRVEVDLCLKNHVGPWMSEIPREVNLLPENAAFKRVTKSLVDAKSDGDWAVFLLTKLAIYTVGVWYRIFKHRKVDEIGFGQIRYEITKFLLPKRLSDKKYDLCLVFGGAPGYSKLVNACKSVAWIHTDWSTYCPIPWLARRQFRHLDYVVNVSDKAKEIFDSIVELPKTTRSVVVENVLSPKWVAERASTHCDLDCENSDCVKILSVGRVTPPKNYFRALEAAKILNSKGFNFRWVIVGDGEIMPSLSVAVKESGLGDKFQLLGSRDNPYPFYKWCDMLVCTSDWEGKSVAVREAQMFSKPVVCTRFPTAPSQIEDGVNGILVKCDAAAVANAIIGIADDKEKRNLLAKNCAERDYANLSSIAKILSWIN